MMNETTKILIREGSIEECLEIQQQIPEFSDSRYDKTEYESRLNNTKSLILVALSENRLVGFKVGYATAETQFYSWMGGILPEFRQKQVAKQLADYQELWAKENGFKSVFFKTRNYLKPMLIFALKNGFFISEVEKREPIQESRIILEKELK